MIGHGHYLSDIVKLRYFSTSSSTLAHGQSNWDMMSKRFHDHLGVRATGIYSENASFLQKCSSILSGIGQTYLVYSRDEFLDLLGIGALVLGHGHIGHKVKCVIFRFVS